MYYPREKWKKWKANLKRFKCPWIYFKYFFQTDPTIIHHSQMPKRRIFFFLKWMWNLVLLLLYLLWGEHWTPQFLFWSPSLKVKWSIWPCCWIWRIIKLKFLSHPDSSFLCEKGTLWYAPVRSGASWYVLVCPDLFWLRKLSQVKNLNKSPLKLQLYSEKIE